MIKKKNRREQSRKVHRRVRVKVSGTTERPRLAVYKSGKHIYAQVIDDVKGVTVASASTVDKELKEKLSSGSNVDAAKIVGTTVAQRAKSAGVENVVFDRGGFLYHGRISALADAAREEGLQF